MPKPLRVLLIEDSADDAELVELELIRGGLVPDMVRVPAARAGVSPGQRAFAVGSSMSGTWTWRFSR